MLKIVGETFQISEDAFTETEQWNEEQVWTAKHNKHSTSVNMRTVITSILEDTIDSACHLGGGGMAGQEYGC